MSGDRVLIVDDEPTVVRLCTRILTDAGYQVMTASEGEEALTKIFDQLPDLVLLDVAMPGLSGFEVCRRLKADTRTQLVPVIFLTALAETQYKITGLEAGASDFLTKPFDHVELLARTRNLLRIKHLTDQLEYTEGVIFALATAVEAKDPYTEGHLRRVVDLSERLARAIGLNNSQVMCIRYGGILHDVGKIGVSETILCKPGSLTPEEFAEMREHPRIGVRIVEPMRFANEVAPIVHGHHERWDGQGYPNGLAGTEIPIGARIVALVDAYDAMSTDRPYRAALAPQAIREELESGAGKQFDPHLTQLLLHLLQEDGLL